LLTSLSLEKIEVLVVSILLEIKQALLKCLNFNKGRKMQEIKKYIKNKTKIFSLEHGAGEIISLLKFYDGIQDYIEVEFEKGKVAVFPISFKNDLRIISNPIELTSILRSLSSKIVDNNCYQHLRSSQGIGVDIDLDYLTNTIALLVGNVDHMQKDRKLLSNCIDSLVLEVSYVYNINAKSAKGVVSEYMRAA
jgi:RNA polymerase-interacting CarD/CdnL/TRCF family regulator